MAILSLTPREATFEHTEVMTYDAIRQAIAEAGPLEKDEARVGAWFASYVYRGAPCYTSEAAARLFPSTNR